MGIISKTDKHIREHCDTISIKKLKEWGYLSENKTGVITWSDKQTGEVLSRISIVSQVNDIDKPYIRLIYTCSNDTKKIEFDYKVYLEKVGSNLPCRWDTFRYYFLCPKSGKRASMLYKPPGFYKFAHRDSHGLIYLNQTESKEYRAFTAFFGNDDKFDKLFNEAHKKYSKKVYRGKFTRRYWNWLRRSEELDRKAAAFELWESPVIRRAKKIKL